MQVIRAVNVNDAYRQGLSLLRHTGELQQSRAGEVLVSPVPVTTVYERPTERVLFDENRNANPFFHLFESLWMLGGRNDTAYLDTFVRNFGSRFAEPNGVIWGAYGHRWRSNWDMDQLDVVVARLTRDQRDRRVVISMWDPTYDLIGPEVMKDGDRLVEEWPAEPRDLPCNTHIYPRLRTAHHPAANRDPEQGPLFELLPTLDLTVCCRSNDVVWGAYGANAVHFSVLLEYLAARLGARVGVLYQVSNNWHGYTSELNRLPVSPEGEDPYRLPAPRRSVEPAPMFSVPTEIDRDIKRFREKPREAIFANRWFTHTALPMLVVHDYWRGHNREQAIRAADAIEATDWRLAVQRWMARRQEQGEGTVGRSPS